jgi:hypothetical protein
MPLTLIVTAGLIPEDRRPDTMARLSEAFLRLHGLAGNKVLTPNVIGHVQEVPPGSTFAGMSPTPVAIVEWLTPSFAFATREIQAAYVREATEIVFDACGGRHPRDRIWVNVRHAVDGAWGIAGEAMTNDALLRAIEAG